jgi:hypothetical protein
MEVAYTQHSSTSPKELWPAGTYYRGLVEPDRRVARLVQRNNFLKISAFLGTVPNVPLRYPVSAIVGRINSVFKSLTWIVLLAEVALEPTKLPPCDRSGSFSTENRLWLNRGRDPASWEF